MGVGDGGGGWVGGGVPLPADVMARGKVRRESHVLTSTHLSPKVLAWVYKAWTGHFRPRGVGGGGWGSGWGWWGWGGGGGGVGGGVPLPPDAMARGKVRRESHVLTSTHLSPKVLALVYKAWTGHFRPRAAPPL